ncbi:MAG: DNA-binding transcriptional LysR family regulator [Oleispira sp.]|jgi:DNA-binding transcriptional LysR family regulator
MAFDSLLLDGMVIFTEVVNSGSFTQAAANSGHSTSYISKEINKLEARLGVRLMQRTTRSLKLTPEGEMYFQHCQQIIADAEQAQSIVSGAQVEPQGTLRISCPTSFAMARLQQVFSDFITQHPKVNLEIDLNNRKVDLIAERFDIAIRASSQLDDSSLISRTIYSADAVVVAAPSYLQQFGIPTTVIELENHSAITYSHLKQPDVWSFINPQGKTETIKVSSRIQTNSSELEISLCVAGHGVMLMPRFNLNGEIERGELVELLTEYQRPEINVYVVYPSRKHMSAKVRSFIDFTMSNL